MLKAVRNPILTVRIPTRPARKANDKDKVELINKVQCFIFDCDGGFTWNNFGLEGPFTNLHVLNPHEGVIWRGDSVIDGVPETLDLLRSLVGDGGSHGIYTAMRLFFLKPSLYLQGKRLFFVTNNSTKSRAGYLKKFTSLGLQINAVSHGVTALW